MPWMQHQVFAGEGRLMILPAGWQHDGKPCVLSGHGHGGAATVPYVGYGWQSTQAMLDAGSPVLYIDAGGPLNWGSAASGIQSDIKQEQALDWAAARFGTHPTLCHLSGFSMGVYNASRFVGKHPERVLSVNISGTPINMKWLHDTNVNGYAKAETETAYGGLAALEADYPNVDPLAMARLGKFANIDVYHSYDPDDDVAPNADREEFTSLCGPGSIHNVVNLAGEGHTPDIHDPAVLKQFILSHQP